MALFTDGPASTIDDLTGQDSQLLNVANAEGINVTVKLALAHEAIGIELEGILRRRNCELHLSNVVVTPTLRLWHTYRTLETVYVDAYNNQLNDRYAGKRDQFRELGKWAIDRLRLMGLGIARQPVPRAATPELRPMAGSLADGAYYVTMTWVNAAGEEGAAATPAVITTSGAGYLALPGAAPATASGWNVYAGTAPENVGRQNDAPIPPDSPWPQTELVRAGNGPKGGQQPNYFHPIPRVIERG